MHFFNSTLYLLVVKSKDSQSRVCDPSGDPRNKVMISAMRLTRTESRDPVDWNLLYNAECHEIRQDLDT